MFDFSLRHYFVRDPEVFKRIAVKDFDHFEDRRGFISEETDEIWGKGEYSAFTVFWTCLCYIYYEKV